MSTRTQELELANRRLADQAQRDPVTGIADLGCAVAHAPGARHRLVTVSIGCASKWPNADLSSTRLTNLADQALYRAEENGRNRVESD